MQPFNHIGLILTNEPYKTIDHVETELLYHNT